MQGVAHDAGREPGYRILAAFGGRGAGGVRRLNDREDIRGVELGFGGVIESSRVALRRID
jgi:hypothetical protein